MKPEQLDLLSYPHAPGSKGGETSRAAAEGIAPRVDGLRGQVLAAIRQRPGTPEQLAHRIGEPLMNVRPRCSELKAKGLIRDSGRRATAMGGRRAVVWEAVPDPAAGHGEASQ